MDIEELEPQKKKAAQRDLATLSVGELETYITELEAEIERVRRDIAAKTAHAQAAAAFFKS